MPRPSTFGMLETSDNAQILTVFFVHRLLKLLAADRSRKVGGELASSRLEIFFTDSQYCLQSLFFMVEYLYLNCRIASTRQLA